jgi:hypothetical protein
MASRVIPPGRKIWAASRRTEVEHGAFDAHLDRARIENKVDPPVEVRQHVVCRGRADPARAIGAGRSDRACDRGQECPGRRMARHAHRHGIEPGGCGGGDAGGAPERQDEGQRARPERYGEPLRASVEDGEGGSLGEPGDVQDQRVVRRPALRLEDPGDRCGVGGEGTQAIDRLGGERHEPAGAERGRGRLYPCRVRGEPTRLHCSARQPMSRRWKPSGQSIRATAP